MCEMWLHNVSCVVGVNFTEVLACVSGAAHFRWSLHVHLRVDAVQHARLPTRSHRFGS